MQLGLKPYSLSNRTNVNFKKTRANRGRVRSTSMFGPHKIRPIALNLTTQEKRRAVLRWIRVLWRNELIHMTI